MRYFIFGLAFSIPVLITTSTYADEVAELASSIVDLQSVLQYELSTFPTLDGSNGVRDAVSSLARLAGEDLACVDSESPDITQAANEVTLLFQLMYPREPATFTQIYVENQVRVGLREGCNGEEVFDEVFGQAVSSFQFIQNLTAEIQSRESELMELIAN